MRIAGLTPEEWARDTLTMIQHGEVPQLILTALVERIAAEVSHEMAAKYLKNQREEQQARIDAATRFNGERVN